jgi:hypothetical protein
MVDETHYGQLLAVYDLEVNEDLWSKLDPDSLFDIDLPEHYLLALVHPCPTKGVDASVHPVIYRTTDFRTEATVIIDLKDVENVVGRVELPEIGGYGIIDRVMGCARLTFAVDDNELIREV